MPVAGFCSGCGENVYLDANWSCPRGHGWNAVSGWYDTATGAAVTPPWTQHSTPAPTAAEPAIEAIPEPEPVPAPDPVAEMSRLIRERLEALNLTVTEHDGALSANRGDEYECAVAVDGANGRLVFWERLRSGRDPGVRDAVRTLGEGGWGVRVVLKRSDVTG